LTTGSRADSWRYSKALAIGSWLVSVGVFAVQFWVLLDPTADTIRTLLPDWPHDPTYDAYLRGLAWGDVLFSQPLWLLAGVGLWRQRRWGLIAGVGVGGVAIYYSIMQIAAQLLIGGPYSLYGLGAAGALLADTFLAPLADWIGLLPFTIFPAALGAYCAFRLRVADAR
jgi:hypothetical protein